MIDESWVVRQQQSQREGIESEIVASETVTQRCQTSTSLLTARDIRVTWWLVSLLMKWAIRRAKPPVPATATRIIDIARTGATEDPPGFFPFDDLYL